MRIGFNTLSENPKSPSGSLDFFIQMTKQLLAQDPKNDYYIFVSKTNRHLFKTGLANENLITAGTSNEKRILRILSEQLLFPILLWKYKIDIFFTSSGGGVAPLYIPKSTKLVIGVYGTQHFQNSLSIGCLRTKYRKYFSTVSFKRASKIIVNSESCKNDVSSILNADDRIKVIYHGLNKTYFNDRPLDRAEKELLIEKNVTQPYVLFVSVLWHYKNVHTLIEAFGKLISKTNLPHSLVIVGQFDKESAASYAYKKRLLDIAYKYNIINKVNFVGYIPNKKIRPFYYMADVYVQPSLYETFGKTVLEAMACGCPTIGANNSSIPEIIDDAGLLFDSEDCIDLASKIELILMNEELRKQLINKGLHRCKFFAIENEAAQLKEVFCQAYYGN